MIVYFCCKAGFNINSLLPSTGYPTLTPQEDRYQPIHPATGYDIDPRCRLQQIIDQKLRAHVQFSPRQKGFMNEPGCFNNVHILNELLNISKKRAG
jgi:hypothetical protein